MAPSSVGSTANHTTPLQNIDAANRGRNTPSAVDAAARFLASVLNATRDQAAADKKWGKPSSGAAGVETKIRQAFKSWIYEDTPTVAAKVRVLDSSQFENVYRQAGGEADDITTVNAFTETDSGTVRAIWVRDGADNQETLTHEFLHAYASPQFKSVGQSFVVGSGRDRSDLSEGAVKFLTARLMGDAWHGPPAQSASIVSDIVETMTVEKAAAAFFHGDAEALDAFRELAAKVPGIVVNEEAPPRGIEEMMAVVASSSTAVPPGRIIPGPGIPSAQVPAVRQRAAEIAARILEVHRITPPGVRSELDDLIDRITDLVTKSARFHFVQTLAESKSDVCRSVATRAVNETISDRSKVERIVWSSNVDAEVRGSLGFFKLSDLVPTFTPMWQKRKAQAVGQFARPRAERSLAELLETQIDIGTDQSDENRRLLTSEIETAVTTIVPGVVKSLVYDAVCEIVADQIRNTGAPQTLSSAGWRYEVIRKLRAWVDNHRAALTYNDMAGFQHRLSQIPEGSGLDRAGRYAAVEAARSAGERVRANAKARADTGARIELRNAIEELPAEGLRSLVREPPTGEGSRTQQQWTEDRDFVQNNVQNLVRRIAALAVDKYKDDYGQIGANTGTRFTGAHTSNAYYVSQAVADIETEILNNINAAPDPADAQDAELRRMYGAVHGDDAADRRAKDSKLALQAAEQIVLRVLRSDPNNNITTLQGLVTDNTVPRDDARLVNARTQALADINAFGAGHARRTTAAATRWVGKQPEINRAISNSDPVNDRDRMTLDIRHAIKRGVIDRNAIPNPMSGGKVPPYATWNPNTWLEAFISSISPTLFMGKATYNRDVFQREMLPLLPQRIRDGLASALAGEPDQATGMLANIPFGLSTFVADVHIHPWDYGRRQGVSHVQNVLDQSDPNSIVLSQAIPQFCCGVGHYSHPVPPPGTMKNAPKLDLRALNDWQKIYDAGNYRDAARADISITGVNFSPNPPVRHQAFDDPAGYIRDLLLRFEFLGVGEITSLKEMIIKQLGGRWRWLPGGEKFQDTLLHLNESGQLLLLHFDWGDHALSASGRPSPARMNYEHFDMLAYVFGRPEYKNVQPVFCHTGIGRFVRPNDRTSTKTHTIKTWEWDPVAKTGRVTRETTKQVTAPEHIHKVYELFEAVPNALGDFSWNEVMQAYNDLMHSGDTQTANAIIEMFIDLQDKLMYGSDVIKPVNAGQLYQSLTTGAPLFAAIAQKDIAAARNRAGPAGASLDVGGLIDGGFLTQDNAVIFKLLRGNYNKRAAQARERIWDWKVSHGVNPGDPNDPNTMAGRYRILNQQRQAVNDGAWQSFRQWAGDLDKVRIKTGQPVNWLPGSEDFNDYSIGVFPEIFKVLPDSTHLNMNEGTPTGVGTSGGFNNDSVARRVAAGALSIGLAGASAAAIYGVTKGLNAPTDPGGLGLALQGSTTTDRVNDAAFIARGLLGVLRVFYIENLRLEWEKMFEQSVVTRQTLDNYLSRLFNASTALGFTALQRAYLAAAGEQFWVNYTYLRDNPIDPTRGLTEDKKFLDLHGKSGAFQVAASRILHVQDSAVDATDARRFQGQVLRGLLIGTYGINVAVSVIWLLQNGWKDFTNLKSLAEGIFRILFALGNATWLTREIVSLSGGLASITDTETGEFARALQQVAAGELTLGGAAWTFETVLDAVFQIKEGSVRAGVLDIVTALFKAAFTWYMAVGMGHEYKRDTGGAMPKPHHLAVPVMLGLGALAIAAIFAEGTGE